jgi:hypothetical protein
MEVKCSQHNLTSPPSHWQEKGHDPKELEQLRKLFVGDLSFEIADDSLKNILINGLYSQIVW